MLNKYIFIESKFIFKYLKVLTLYSYNHITNVSYYCNGLVEIKEIFVYYI